MREGRGLGSYSDAKMSGAPGVVLGAVRPRLRAARPPAVGVDSGAGIGTVVQGATSADATDDLGAAQGDLIAGHRPARGFRGRFRARTTFNDLGAVQGRLHALARCELNFNAGLWPFFASTLRTGPAIGEALLQNRFSRTATWASCPLCRRAWSGSMSWSWLRPPARLHAPFRRPVPGEHRPIGGVGRTIIGQLAATREAGH